MVESVSLANGLAEVAAAWAERRAAGGLTPRTEQLYVRHLETFARFATASGVTSLADLTPGLCRAWVAAPVSAVSPGSRARAGQPVAAQTRRGRQGALRAAARIWVDRGWVDPALVPADVITPDRSPGPIPPLTPSEVARLRVAGRLSTADTVSPAAVELALAGAAQADIAAALVADFDPRAATLRLAGRGQSRPRVVALEPAAVATLDQRVDALRRAAARKRVEFDTGTAPLAMGQPLDRYQPQSLAPAVAHTLHRALRAAGIDRAGVRAGSLQSYAANRRYALTGRVEDVADVLGLRSLDAARRRLDADWQAAWADQIRGDAAAVVVRG